LGRINVADGTPQTKQKTRHPNDTFIRENIMSTQTFPITGLTCGHCVGAVTSELSVLAGVQDVQIDLIVEGISTLRVTTDKELTEDEVVAALSEAGGYQLASV
jgi:copper chaperone